MLTASETKCRDAAALNTLVHDSRDNGCSGRRHRGRSRCWHARCAAVRDGRRRADALAYWAVSVIDDIGGTWHRVKLNGRRCSKGGASEAVSSTADEVAHAL